MLELNLNAGRETECRAFIDEMSIAARSEPGTLDFEWSVSADGVGYHVFERYSDSAAVVTHLGAFGEKFAARFRDIFKCVRLVVYGAPNPEVKAALAGLNPIYMQPAGGFSR